MTKTQYRINKTGTFPIKFSSTSRCGMGKRVFAFSFSVTTPDVDARGFVVDHFEVEDHLQTVFRDKTYTYSGSCEQLAVTVGQIISMFIDPALRRRAVIEVTLQGADKQSGASVTLVSSEFVNLKGVVLE